MHGGALDGIKALDGLKEPEKCFVIRGGGGMENHFECRWDLFRSTPVT